MKTFGFLIAIVVSIFIACSAQAQLVTYDSFSGPYLDRGNWFVSNPVGDNITVLEGGLLIKGGKLWFFNRAFGGEGSDTNRQRMRRRLVMQDGSGITSMETSVQVKAQELTGCDANTTPSLTQIGLGGAFFNDLGSCVAAGDFTGDVMAFLHLEKYSDDDTVPAGYMRVKASVYRCNNADCTGSTEIGTGVDLGLIKAKSKTRLFIMHDEGQEKFVFQTGKGRKMSEGGISYAGHSDAAGPCGGNGGQKRLEVAHFLANCTAGATRGWADSYFDYLSVNP